MLLNAYCIPKETNINDVPPPVIFKLEKLLDNSPTKNWRRLIEAMPQSPYSPVEVEKFALSWQRRESPTGNLLYDLGSRGKTVEQLVSYLWTLEHGDALKLFLNSIPVQVTKQPVPQLNITEGEEIKLDCNASGLPFPMYQWFHGNNEVDHAVDKTLVIKNSKVENSGTYCCRVYNGDTSTVRFTDKSRVIVAHKKVHGFAPKITTEPSDTFIMASQPVKLTCQAYGVPEPEYQWFKNSVKVECATRSDLYIPQADVADDAVYFCIATNTFGRAQSKAVHLFVDHNTQVQETRFSATDKVALLIGNYKYTNAEPLNGVPKDIEQLSRVFTTLGFKVISLINLTVKDMEYYIKYFCSLLDKGVYGVFYFGGHGFELNYQTYLMGVDAHFGFKITDSVCAQKIRADMQEREPALCVLILDVCRKEHKEAIKADHEKETKYVCKDPGNCVLFYATSPGYKAFDAKKNGVLWDHLSKFVPQTNLTVNEVFLKTVESMGNDHREEVCKQQLSAMSFNLRYKRKFNDPIDYTGHTKNYKIRSLHWEQALRVPRPIRCDVGGYDVRVSFHSVFNNQLKVCTEVMNHQHGFVAYITKIPATVSCEKAEADKDYPLRLRQDIDDLQQLKGPLVGEITVVHDGAQQCVASLQIDLGYPLVAALNQGVANSDRRQATMAPYQPPHSQLFYSRVPTESSDLDYQ